ncbi:hypothetical protein NE237_006419 [Protea cynaroides]|uniref:Uncharacterized protein n=1 Tax=Protea cynaroides TaxID=273540 RepID=A0A9Q0QVF0_9MAGN|nr:hypothetical protein NE237_006419 [Protea cynaroides]
MVGQRSVKQVLWVAPMHRWYKVNTDGCSKGNPGEASTAGVVRDTTGKSLDQEALRSSQAEVSIESLRIFSVQSLDRFHLQSSTPKMVIEPRFLPLYHGMDPIHLICCRTQMLSWEILKRESFRRQDELNLVSLLRSSFVMRYWINEPGFVQCIL